MTFDNLSSELYVGISDYVGIRLFHTVQPLLYSRPINVYKHLHNWRCSPLTFGHLL